MSNVITGVGTLAALRAARHFIVNGVELGFIRMPDADTPDPAHDTLPMIEWAIAGLEAGADEVGVQFRIAKGAEVTTGTVDIREGVTLAEAVDAMLEGAFPLTVAAIARSDQPRVAVNFEFPPLPAGLTASFRDHMESAARSPGPKFTVSGGCLELLPAPAALTNEGSMSAVIGTVVGGDCSDNTVTVQVIGDVPSKLWTMGEAVTLTHGHLTATTDFDDVLAGIKAPAAAMEPRTYADEPLSHIKAMGELVQDAKGIEISGNARKVGALLLCGAAVPELVARIEELEGAQ